MRDYRTADIIISHDGYWVEVAETPKYGRYLSKEELESVLQGQEVEDDSA